MGLRSRSACQRATTPGQALTTLAARRLSDDSDAGRAGPRLEVGVLLLQELACARDGAARADAGHQEVDLAARLRPAPPGRLSASSFRDWPAPERVPPVPTPATRKSILPPVCALRPLAGSVLWS